MTDGLRRTPFRWSFAVLLALVLASPACETMPPAGNPNDNNVNGNGNQNGNTDDGPFEPIEATEVMVEAVRSNMPNGDSRVRDERFTAEYTLTPTSAEERQVFLNNELTIAISGNLTGQAHCTYEESGTDVIADLECPTTTYEGAVEWDVMIEGSYDYIPALDEVQITAHAVDVSSPQYTVTFTTPGCPELDSMNPAAYSWQGPGQGVWGFVTIVLKNGQFHKKLDNPLADDLGAIDYYEITLGAP